MAFLRRVMIKQTIKSISFLLAWAFVVLPLGMQAQNVAPIGQWTAYLSHKATVDIVQKGPEMYTITEGGFFSYHTNTSEIRTFSTIEGLSAINPTTIYHDESSGTIFIGFQDGMINFFTNPDQLNFITDIFRSELFTTKTINRFISRDSLLYIATEFGIVVYDINKKETRFSITKIGDNNTGTAVRDITLAGDSIWVALGSRGLYKASLNEPNLTVPTVWIEESGKYGMPDGNNQFVTHTGDWIYSEVNDTIFRKLPGVGWLKSPMRIAPYSDLQAEGDVVWGTHGSTMEVIYTDSNLVLWNNQGTVDCGYVKEGIVWIGDHLVGLQRAISGIETVSPGGPKNNFVTQIAAGNGEVYIAPNGKKGFSNRFFDASGIPYFSVKNGGWTVLDARNGDLPPSKVYRDFARTHYDLSTGHCYMGSWGEGIVECYQGDTVRFYTPDNSGITNGASVGSMWTRVSGLDMDPQGNLWISLMVNDYEINVKTPDDQWYYFNLSSVNPTGITVDSWGNKWVIDQNNGIVVFNDNGTLDNPGDDQLKRITSDLGSGSLPNNSVFTVVEDQDGLIWVGTSEGATVFYDPGSIFTSNFQDASCPIIDGFCLLRDQKVTAIAVDGANRKWVGTENGVYLISEDGTEQLAHYTTDNSPIFNDEIKHIAIDQSTGEVFIGTNAGMISFMGEATQGDDECDGIYTFPNPVRYDFDGNVAIRGTSAGAQVKITTVDGRLVRDLDALGGQATWDLKDEWGNRARPGIYLVLVADRDGNGSCISKVAVLDPEQ